MLLGVTVVIITVRLAVRAHRIKQAALPKPATDSRSAGTAGDAPEPESALSAGRR
jgi:hypothetical protein